MFTGKITQNLQVTLKRNNPNNMRRGDYEEEKFGGVDRKTYDKLDEI